MRELTPHNFAVAHTFNNIEALRDNVLKEFRQAQEAGRLLPDSQVEYTEKVFNMILDFIDKKCFND